MDYKLFIQFKSGSGSIGEFEMDCEVGPDPIDEIIRIVNETLERQNELDIKEIISIDGYEELDEDYDEDFDEEED